MSVTLALPRHRRTLATVAAAALALAGLVSLPTQATAATTPTVTISPTSVAPDVVTDVTVSVEGGSSTNVATARITPPTGYTSVSVVSKSPSGWSTTIPVAGSFQFSAPAANDKLGEGDVLSVVFQLRTPAATGATGWAVSTWSNTGANGTPNYITTSTVTVGSTSQVITFAPLADKIYGDAPFTVSATGGASGNPVTFTTSGTCTNSGTVVSITGAGTCSVTANQAGGGGYTAAPPVTRSFDIAKADQTITFDAIDTKTYNDAPFSLDAASSSGLAITYGATGSCTVDGDSVTIDGAGSCTITADQGGNANFNAAPQQSRTFTINKAGAVLSLSDLTHDYDGSSHHAAASTDPTGLSGVSVTYSQDGNPVAEPTDAGSYDVVATLDNANYAAETATGTLVINARHITGDFTVSGRTYDGSTDAEVLTRSLNDTVAGDDVSLSGGTATFDSKNAGPRTATLSGATLAGDDAGNYVLDSVGTATATIGQAAVTASIVAADKTYDGSTSAEITEESLSGVLGSDQVGLTSADAQFAQAGIGTNLPVSATITLTGADKDNYQLTSTTATTTASIYAVLLTGSFTADSKTYDGNTGATAHPAALTGIVGTEDVTLVVSNAHFADKNVGDDKVVTADLSLAGDDVANYELTSLTGTTTADITAKLLTGSVTAQDKVYDGNTSATAVPAGLTGIVGSEVVTLVVDSAAFGTKDVGTDKTVTAQLSLTGADAGNYDVNATATDTADITPAPLTATIVADDKVYDGGVTAATHPTLPGIVDGDDVTVSSNGTFADKNVGTGKLVTATIGINGDDASNYSVNATATDTADITPAPLTATIAADNKVYDGGVTAATHPSLTGVLGVDDVTVSSNGTFADKNVGTDKTVTANLTLGGTDAGNYTVNATATDTANITPATVNGSFTAADKVWDGNAAATITGRDLSGEVSGDDVALSGGAATFDNANVGTNKTVTGTGFTLSGADSGNYLLTSSTLTTTASISALYSGNGFFKPVDMTPADGTRIYNTIKGGQTVPMKFEIFNAVTLIEQTSVTVFGPDPAAQAAAFKFTRVDCTSGASTSDAVEVVTTGGTSLRYDTTGGQFIQNWKTPTGAGSCYSVTVKTVDGTTVGPAYFKITK